MRKPKNKSILVNGKIVNKKYSHQWKNCKSKAFSSMEKL
jgi:hypothetical protein